MPRAGSEAVIAGLGEPPVGRLTGKNPTELHIDAAMLAIEDSGIEKMRIRSVLDALYQDLGLVSG